MSKSKPHILIFVDWYVPGYKAGGPIRSVSNMVSVLKNDFDFSIVTSNCDFGELVPYAGIEPDVWIEQDGARVMYLSKENTTKATMFNIVESTPATIAYFNSFFSAQFTLMPLRIIKKKRRDLKIVLAPRGMLATGALQIKATKKRIFISVAKLTGLYSGITWHASTTLEAKEIQAVFGAKSKIEVAENIALLDDGDIHANRPVKERGSAKFFFVSRIALKKNLLAAIQYFEHVAGTGSVEFEVFGPIDEAHYWGSCQEATQKAKGAKIQHKGVLPHHEIGEMERSQHFFVLPTFNENYGHVIVEALANGCPVILSDQTPWLGLEEKGIGWDIPLDDETQWHKVLQRCIDMDFEEFKQMSEHAAAFGRMVVGNEITIARNRELFANI
jgi:glycosyltransferase involved in cell wall biosynthesis